jgi:hypothetical protein
MLQIAQYGLFICVLLTLLKLHKMKFLQLLIGKIGDLKWFGLVYVSVSMAGAAAMAG